MSFPPQAQRSFVTGIIARFGFADDSWRLDPTVHPFATSAGTEDIRITTRYYDDTIGPALFGSMHECGHGLYEQHLPAEYFGTPAGEAPSQALHESQARLWENAVGHSRAFWRHFFPLAREHFPAALAGVGPDEFHFAVNAVAPTLIRASADQYQVLSLTPHGRDVMAGRVEDVEMAVPLVRQPRPPRTRRRRRRRTAKR